nr:variable large family protein [Borrelia sp. BU AG58]
MKLPGDQNETVTASDAAKILLGNDRLNDSTATNAALATIAKVTGAEILAAIIRCTGDETAVAAAPAAGNIGATANAVIFAKSVPIGGGVAQHAAQAKAAAFAGGVALRALVKGGKLRIETAVGLISRATQKQG